MGEVISAEFLVSVGKELGLFELRVGFAGKFVGDVVGEKG